MDYDKIGLKAGLEIHQQLDSGKLYCRCPSYLRKDKADFEIMRRLHQVPGESGAVDLAVAHEASLNKEFIYEGYDDTTCLVELDEEPPKKVDEEALDIAIQISLLMNCEIVQTSQIMRKMVIDGSNPGGFQRTVMIAKDGYVDTKSGQVGIWYVYLEEDAARKVSEEKGVKRFRVDRLGVPLVEVVTAPDIRSAQQAREVALKIGEILRACKVKRGLGTIRQDINVSIKGHPRAEIKGFQDPKIFVNVVDKEIERQQKILKTGAELKHEVRGANEDATTKFLRPLPGGARMYPETDLPLLRIHRDRINRLKKDLPKMKDELRTILKKKGLSENLIDLVLDGNYDEFSMLIKVEEKDAPMVAKMVTLWRKDIGTKQKKTFQEMKEILTERILEEILEAISRSELDKGDVKGVMEAVASGKKLKDALKVEKASDDEMEEEIAKIVKEKPGMRPNAYMGLVMAKFKGKLDAKKAMEIVNKVLK